MPGESSVAPRHICTLSLGTLRALIVTASPTHCPVRVIGDTTGVLARLLRERDVNVIATRSRDPGWSPSRPCSAIALAPEIGDAAVPDWVAQWSSRLVPQGSLVVAGHLARAGGLLAVARAHGLALDMLFTRSSGSCWGFAAALRRSP